MMPCSPRFGEAIEPPECRLRLAFRTGDPVWSPAVRRNHATSFAFDPIGRHQGQCRDYPGGHTGPPLRHGPRNCHWGWSPADGVAVAAGVGSAGEGAAVGVDRDPLGTAEEG